MHPRTEVIQSGKVRNLDVTESLTYQGSPVAPGGGGVTGFTTSVNSTSPNDLAHASVLAANSSTNDVDIVLQTKTQGAIIAGLAPNGLASGGDKRGTYAVDLQISRANNTQVASGVRSGILSGQSNRVSSGHSVIGGGLTNSITVPQSFIGGGQTNSIVIGNNAVISGGQNNTITSTGSHQTIGGGSGNECRDSYSTVSGGQSNLANGGWSTVSGGYANSAGGQYANIGGGIGNYAQAAYACTTGGRDNQASSQYSVVVGGWANTCAVGQYNTIVGGSFNINYGTNSIVVGGSSNYIFNSSEHCTVIGKANQAQNNEYGFISGWGGLTNTKHQRVHAYGYFNFQGDAQYARYGLLARTTDATQTEMSSSIYYSAAETSIYIAPNVYFAFEGIVTVKRHNTTNECASWKIAGSICNNAGTTALVGAVTYQSLGDNTGGTASIFVSADNTLDILSIKVTGAVGKSYKWVAVVWGTQVMSPVT